MKPFNLTQWLLGPVALFAVVCSEGCKKSMEETPKNIVKPKLTLPPDPTKNQVDSAVQSLLTNSKDVFGILLPNLKITNSTSYIPCSPIKYKVSNTGLSRSGAFYINVTKVDGSEAWGVSQELTNNLNPGETREFTFSETPMPRNMFWIVTADPTNAVRELSKKDNVINITSSCVH